jgi:hypothetical protein
MKTTFLRLTLCLSGLSSVGCSGAADVDVLTPIGDDDEAASLSQTGMFYAFSRAGEQRCQESSCDGNYLRRVNFSTTKCVDGKFASDCLVHKVDYSRLGLSEAEQGRFVQAFETGHALLRAKMRTGKLDDGSTGGVLAVSEAWLGSVGANPEGTFYRVQDQGMACLVAPCPSLREAKLNSTVEAYLGGIEFPSASASAIADANAALASRDGVLAVGTNVKQSDGLLALKATEFYLRVQPKPAAPVCPPASSTVRYVSQEPSKCAAITFSCEPTEQLFSNTCGCGCALLE